MDYEYDFIDWARQDTELYFSMTQTGIPIEAQPFIFSYDHQGSGDVKKEIKYLHQLQNLYFDLTGDELTINQ